MPIPWPRPTNVPSLTRVNTALNWSNNWKLTKPRRHQFTTFSPSEIVGKDSEVKSAELSPNWTRSHRSLSLRLDRVEENQRQSQSNAKCRHERVTWAPTAIPGDNPLCMLQNCIKQLHLLQGNAELHFCNYFFIYFSFYFIFLLLYYFFQNTQILFLIVNLK